jgi:hypothetical protein
VRYLIASESGRKPAIGVRTYNAVFEGYLGGPPRLARESGEAGALDDVRIYNRNLSAEEVWQLYQSGL